MNNFYVLTNVDYDSCFSQYFVSENKISKDEFKALCDSLFNQAVAKVLQKAYDNTESDRKWITWNDITDEISVMLGDFGFLKVVPVEASYPSSIIVEDENSEINTLLTFENKEQILDYNKIVLDNASKGIEDNKA